ncbi:MAG: nucleotide exchange factor GrpE [Firmicutes bacterium]|nr:nucleotide exchange factor GrpE [Bacillota bacterium]
MSEQHKWQASAGSVERDDTDMNVGQVDGGVTSDVGQDPGDSGEVAGAADGQTAPAGSGQAGSEQAGSEQAGSDLFGEVSRLREQVAELESRLLRTYADFDNLRRRTRQEKDELIATANARLIEKLLPVLDHFEMAQQVAAQSADEGLRSGIDMVYKQLHAVLRDSGLAAIDPVGDAFDATIHEAVATEEAPGTEPGTVIATLRMGYSLSGKVIRPPMVRVAQ